MDASVWAAWAGAGVSALGAATVLWVRWRDRPQADWHFERIGVQTSGAMLAHFASRHGGREPDLVAAPLNVGDGAAYAVRVEGEGCDAELFLRDKDDVRGFSTPQVAGRVDSNESIGVFVWLTQPAPSNPSVVTLRWVDGPTRHRRSRVHRVALLGDLPERPALHRRLVSWLRHAARGT